MRRDPIELEIFKNLYHSIAEEMGAALRRTAFSPNIKERRDYSCAVFDGRGQVIAMGDHMPVHLGSMPMSVRAAIDAGADGTGRRGHAQRSLSRRDASARHHAGRAGLCRRKSEGKMSSREQARTPALATRPDFYVASRAHHADVGGAYPGSMGLCREIYQEGVRIPPVRTDARGRDGCRCPGDAAQQRTHTRGTRGRLGGADRRLSHRRRTAAEVCARYGVERARRAARICSTIPKN